MRRWQDTNAANTTFPLFLLFANIRKIVNFKIGHNLGTQIADVWKCTANNYYHQPHIVKFWKIDITSLISWASKYFRAFFIAPWGNLLWVFPILYIMQRNKQTFLYLTFFFLFERKAQQWLYYCSFLFPKILDNTNWDGLLWKIDTLHGEGTTQFGKLQQFVNKK